MKKYFALISLFFLLAACEPFHSPAIDYATADVTVYIEVPAQEYLNSTTASLQMRDVNMNQTYTFAPTDTTEQAWVFTFPLKQGFYDLSFEDTLRIDGTPVQLRYQQRNMPVQQASWSQQLTAHVVQVRQDFVLAEVFFSGTLTPEGKQYIGDKYFIILNNSDEVLYADSLILMESKFLTVRHDLVRPDLMDSAFTVHALYRIPGDGTTYPVQPGAALLIADNALDHREFNENSFDLSHADFEWFDASTVASVQDVDNPAVPNLDKIYCYTLSIWVPHNQGHKSYAIGRMPAGMSDEEYLQKYYYPYDYTLVTSAGTFEMSNSAYLFPNEWIIDAVNISASTTFQWIVTDPRLDAGWTYVAETGSDKTRYFKSVRRKELPNSAYTKLVDTNNSTFDFLPAQTADPYYFK